MIAECLLLPGQEGVSVGPIRENADILDGQSWPGTSTGPQGAPTEHNFSEHEYQTRPQQEKNKTSL